MERQSRSTPDHVSGRPKGSADPGRTVDDDDALDALLARPSDEPEDAAKEVHPFDREPDRPPPPDAASVRAIPAAEREEFWSALSDHPWGFDFFGAVRRMEALYPELPGFGASNRASEDTVRFCQHPSLAFAPCTLSELRPATAVAPSRMFVNFMGMLGPNGPMPLHLTEHAHLRELHHKDRTFTRFLDVFNHRMVSMFYRAWAACQMPASFDRTPPAALRGDVDYRDRQRILAAEKDRYPVYIGSLFGMGMDSVRHRDAVPDTAKLFFAGRIVGPQNGPEGLRAILSAYFKVPVTVEEFAGRWMKLPSQYWSRLGGGPTPEARSAATLGTATGGAMTMGSHVWDCQGKFRVVLGPMSLSTFVTFIPGQPSARRLSSWIRNYCGDEFAWEAVIVLRKEEVPGTKLGGEGIGSRLGWTTWMHGAPVTSDRADLAIRSRE